MDKINLGNGTVGSGDSAVVGGGKINDNFIAVVLSLNGDTIWDGETSSVIDLSGLNTDDKSDLVAAINSILASKGVANGISSLDANGFVPDSQISDSTIDNRIVLVVDKSFVDALGIDADTLDGLDSSAFYLASNPNNYIDASNVVFDNTTQTITGAKTFSALLTLGNELLITGETIYGGDANGSFARVLGSQFYRFKNSAGTIKATIDLTNGDIITDGGATFGMTVTAGNFKLSSLNSAPSSASDTGTTGEIRFTSDYIYMCVATNTWKRSPLSTW